ncbi:hypothetical protein Tco_0148429, partial [Tanacetum coccineum]
LWSSDDDVVVDSSAAGELLFIVPLPPDIPVVSIVGGDSGQIGFQILGVWE